MWQLSAEVGGKSGTEADEKNGGHLRASPLSWRHRGSYCHIFLVIGKIMERGRGTDGVAGGEENCALSGGQWKGKGWVDIGMKRWEAWTLAVMAGFDWY